MNAANAAGGPKGRGLFWPAAMTAAALVILCALGAWQLQRMHWKNGIIAQVEASLLAPPQPIAQWLASPERAAFRKVAANGRFQHERERYVYTIRRGRAGYLVFTPLAMDSADCGGRTPCEIWVNRGYAPEAFRDPARRAAAQTLGGVRVVGMTRQPEAADIFTPDPDEKARIWFAASFPKDFYLEADASSNPGGWPQGRDGADLIAAIPNRHAEYAFTWFSLAAVLAGVFAAYARGRLRVED